MRADGVSAWCLVREIVTVRNETKPGEFMAYHDLVDSKIVAMFNFDSDAETFQRFLFEKTGHISIDPDVEARELQRRDRNNG